MPHALTSAPVSSQLLSSSPTSLSAEAQLQFSELRYRRLFETAPDGIIILNGITGQIVAANPRVRKILGYSEADVLGKELWEIGIFKDALDSKTAFHKLQHKGLLHFKELPIQTKTGQTLDIEFISNLYTVDQEKVIQCNIRDISARRKAEAVVKSRSDDLEKLSKSQDQTKRAMLNVMEDLEEAKAQIELEKVKDEAIFASIGEGLIAVDTDKKVIMVNSAAETILGWKLKELWGKELNILPLEDEEGHVLPFGERPTNVALETGKLVKANYFFVRKNKTRFPIAINVTPIKLGGKIIGAIDIFRDITDEKEIDKAKSEFVSLASHQLRTPLGIIKWYLEALDNESYMEKAPELVKDYFTEVYKSSERVLSLVRDLLSVSRIDQGRVQNVTKSVDIAKLIREVTDQMQIIARKKKIELQLKMTKKQLPKIDIDVLRFHEVIENLVGNAIEYSTGNVSVKIEVSLVGKVLQICVKDQGIGISKADQKKLFTKFFRAERAIVHNPEGSGLGLYVVKSYVENWGGTITAESVEDKGSTFTIRLPLTPKAKLGKENAYEKNTSG